MKTWEDPSPDKNRNQHWQNFPQWQNALRKTDQLQTTMLWRSVKTSTNKIISMYKALKRGHNFVRLENIYRVIFHLSWCASLAIMLYVIRHAVNAKSVENYFLFRWVEIHYIPSQDQGILHVFPSFLVRCPHSCKSNAYWLHCPQTGNPLMSPGLAALKNTFPQTICICKGKINISV